MNKMKRLLQWFYEKCYSLWVITGKRMYWFNMMAVREGFEQYE
jgi:hypothetical protein